MENIRKEFEQFKDINNLLRDDCITYLKNILKDKEKINFDSDEYVEYKDSIHDIYNSNCPVYSIFLKDDTIYLDTEESSFTDLEDLDTYDIYYITEAIAHGK